jgi:baculoviral IAP repeat-containing protein 7/8
MKLTFLFFSIAAITTHNTLLPIHVHPNKNNNVSLLPSPPPPPSNDLTDNHDYDDMCFHDLHREEERLKTFKNWPLSFLSPQVLARNGFYYLGRGDEVRCAFCKVEIMRWNEGEDPAVDHQRWAPQCPFLKSYATTGNVPMNGSMPSPGRDECGSRAGPSKAGMSTRMPGPVHPQYSTMAARCSSFKDWPRCMRQKPEDLAEAGFFYTGQGDKTKCYYCDGGLKDWENDDIPWEQHARWFDRCAYVQLVKGKEYIQRVKSDACMILAPKEEIPTTEPIRETIANNGEEKPIDDSKLCKICYEEEHNTVFIPCGHVACAKCALSTTDNCPMCRRTIQNVIRLYYS